MANRLNQMLQEICDNFESLTENPEDFLKPSSEQNTKFKNVTKKIYDIIVPANSLTNLQSKSLPKLLVQGFDDEQIWQQIELQNPNAISHLDAISNINLSSLNLNITSQNGDDPLQESLAKSEDEAMDDENSEQDEDSDQDLDDDDSDEYIDFEKPAPKEKSNKTNATEASPSKSSKKKYKTPVDDQFFKLSKLEKFLRLEDLKEERSFDASKGNDDDLSSEEDINMFEDIPSDDEGSAEESDNETTVKKSSKDLMYEDFFGAPDSGDESIAKSKEGTDEENDDSNADEEASMNGDSFEDTVAKNELPNEAASEKNSRNKTPFQLQLEKTKEQIALFEKGLLEPAPWHLTGEVDASKRPTDALLHLQTDFEVNARPVVIEDKPLCEKLENLLKMTIKNKAYSDGVRQYKTTKEVIAQKKETIIEQNKSTKSLAQEYEDMYLKQKTNNSTKSLAQEYEDMYLKQKTKTEEEENPKHVAIKKLRDSLFPELHALFSHIPKPAVPDIKIVSNLPAISVEEVAPTSVSDVTLLAPEEVKKRSGLVKGMTERDDTDKKRERRKKKALQKLKQKKREKESDEKPASGKLTKKDKLEALKKLKQHRNTKIAGATGEKVKSSKDFFAKLQETVDSNTKQVGVKKKNIKRNI